MLVKSRGDVVLYDDFYKSNIDWKSLSEDKKRELYTEFVLHYLPKELGDAAVGNPITFIIMIIVGAVIAKAGAVIAACAALIGASFSVLNIIEGCKLISKSAEGYDSIYDVNATKVSAKDLARGIALLGIEVIPVLLGLIKRGIAKYNNKEIKIGKKYTGGRTQEELNNLARDPAHKNTTNINDIAKGNHEREIGLDLEKRGKIKNIIRDPTGKAEFIENNGNGQKWDIKSFNSNYPPRKGGFKLERDFAKILNEIKQGENVIVETTNMSSEHINALKNEINKIGLKTNVIFWP